MTLLEKQILFPRLVAQLIQWLESNGYELTFGEAWRTPEMAKLYEQRGQGISNSLHKIRLAIDINLFVQGKWLDKSEDYKPAGEYWESLSTGLYTCCWGGRFGDGVHFSIEHQGVK